MRIINTSLSDVKLIESNINENYLGTEYRTYCKQEFSNFDINDYFCQENHGYAFKSDCFRGVHCQIQPFIQTYLIRCVRGAMLDFAVDLRTESPTFKQSISVVLSEHNYRSVYIPKGFGHGCLSLTDNCEFSMKVSNYYNASAFTCISYKDLDLDIPSSNLIMSGKDKLAKSLKEHGDILKKTVEHSVIPPSIQNNDLTITHLELPEVKIIKPTYYEDYRGFFAESYSAKKLAELGINTVFVQDNYNCNISKGTFRGIHYQNNPHAQGNLVLCTRGSIMYFAIDLRSDSPNFKKWVYAILSENNHKQIWIPRGFGHAYLTLSDDSKVQYKCDDYYYPELHRVIRYDDPEINLNIIYKNLIISESDEKAPFLKDSDVNLFMDDKL